MKGIKSWQWFGMGLLSGVAAICLSWLFWTSRESRLASEEGMVHARIERFNQFVDLIERVGLGDFPSFSEDLIRRRLQRAQQIRGVSAKDTLDALLIELSGDPLGAQQSDALMKWVALGRKEQPRLHLPRSTMVARRKIFDRAYARRDFCAWLDTEWNGWQKLCDGGCFAAATFDASMILDGASPEAFHAFEQDARRPAKWQDLARGRRVYEDMCRNVEAVVRQERTPFSIDLAPAFPLSP